MRAISLSGKAAATAAVGLLITACSDLALPTTETVGIGDLLVLSQQANTPPPESESFWVSNSHSSIVRINHPDNFNTLYLELSFPVRSMATLSGSPLSETDSVYVTVDPRAASYGFTLTPSDIVFRSGSYPTAEFSFAVYGDASGFDSSPNYSTSAEYVSALEIWREFTVDQWEIAAGSGSVGLDGVSAAIESSGRFVLAAPR